MRKLSIAYGASRMAKKWSNEELEWADFMEKLKTPIRTTETVEAYKHMTKAQRDDVKDHGGFVPGILSGNRRQRQNVKCRSMLTHDVDHADADFPDTYKMLCGYESCIYSTHSHTKENPRVRIITPLSRDVTPDEYVAIARLVVEEWGMDLFDDCSYRPHQLMYWPSAPADGEYVFEHIQGDVLDPDVFLAAHPDWKDCSKLPVSSREKENINPTASKQEDPLSKRGIVGAFNRTFTITEAMDRFIPDVYRPSAMEGRYDYVPADSAAGVVIYDGVFAYSHHASDPACGKLMNAFDVVRIHKFGHLDAKASIETESSKLPSYKAMQEFATDNEEVKKTLAREREQSAKMDFATEENWVAKLEYNRRGEIVNSLRNLLLILNNDTNLKGIGFNQLADGMEIMEEVPWEHPSKFWRDADDAQLISYIDLKYGNFSARNYDIAVAKVVDDRSYHPIRNFLNNLPEWDGTKRVDTLLVDFLGASDTPYVRAVTRKTLVAAIARVMQPGIKFDTMLVMSGPQGKGKSTLIAKLCGTEWFSDSLLLSDTRDKTAAEKLQGYWILEIGELAGMKKTEIEVLRGFLSRQNDIYRAAFGRRAVPHPRQCIFIGTTNAATYLRDITGNRRFWPVKTPGDAARNSWELTKEEVEQIWAEALSYFEAKEPLYLPKELEIIAVREQRDAMESDDREGTVVNYLEMLLPDGWEKMSLYERRNYINGSEFEGSHKVGVHKRTRVCNMEIWCECFGKERGNLKRQDANEISAIMSSLDNWERISKKDFGPYGVVVGYERKATS